MNCQKDIIDLSERKLAAANVLQKNGFIDDAYYMAGYAVELLLKASICKTLGIDNFFQEKFLRDTLTFPQTFRNHNIKQLLVLSGLFQQYAKSLEDPDFLADCSSVSFWYEGHRYLTGKTQRGVEDFLISTNNISAWIKTLL